MDLIVWLVDFIVHVDEHLDALITQYGPWTYGFLFLVIFAETGFVVTPFLPGDSLLFAAGSFAARGSLNPVVLFVLLTVAAIVGDAVNYWIGRRLGPRVFSQEHRFLRQEYLVRTQEFYEKHGGKTIVIARFIPIVRTFAPFVAGVGSMAYRRFAFYNVTGALLWVSLFVFGGYLFGTLPAVEDNFTLVIFAIIGLSVLPPVIEAIRSRRERRRQPAP